MQFAMGSSGSTYNRMTRKLLHGTTQNLESYVDDNLGYAKEWQEHNEHFA